MASKTNGLGQSSMRQRRLWVSDVVDNQGATNREILRHAGHLVNGGRFPKLAAEFMHLQESRILKMLERITVIGKKEFKYSGGLISVTFDWRKARSGSWGGVYKAGWRKREAGGRLGVVDDYASAAAVLDPAAAGGGINLAMARYVRGTEFREYEMLREFPDIGTVPGLQGIECYQVLTCHEAAHAIANSLQPSGHGVLWRDIYSRLRHEFKLVLESEYPLWCSLSAEQKTIVAGWKRLPGSAAVFREKIENRDQYNKTSERKRQARRRDRQDKREPQVGECQACGASFERKRITRRFCSDRCRSQAARRPAGV